MLVVVVYDIPDDGTRTKLASFLEGYGRRVQYSVFECFLNWEEVKQLYREVQKRVDSREDNVRFYWISREARERVLTIGSDPPESPPSYYII
ncbi:MAG: CRISPR-associated endonuclease Cas2 [Spirulina sp.]